MTRDIGCRVRAMVICACVCTSGGALAIQAGETMAGKTVQVNGTGVDLLNSAVVHRKQATPTGETQQSTEIVVLEGDLKGRVLYHVTTVIDAQKGTLVNTGDQVFSGTVAGSEPVLIHDSKFHFEVNLATGAESGSVYLDHPMAGPPVRCNLKVTGTGKTAEGNPTFSYGGACTFDGPKSAHP